MLFISFDLQGKEQLSYSYPEDHHNTDMEQCNRLQDNVSEKEIIMSYNGHACLVIFV